MGSIGSTLNSINTSLLAEIQSLSSTTSSGTNASALQPTNTTDRIDFSQAGKLFQQLRQLQKSNPTEFKQVLTDAVSKLRDAANQQTDPAASAFLNKLADRFQKAADTGELSSLNSQSSAGASGSRGHRGHHHGGHVESGNDGGADTGSSTLAPASQTAGTQTTTSLFTLLSSSTTTQSGSSSTQIQSLLASFVTSSSSS